MAEKPDIRVLVGVEGGASINGRSGQLILKSLTSIANNIRGTNTPRVVFGVDANKTKSRLEKELFAIGKGIKNIPIDLTFKSIEKEISKSVSSGIKSGMASYSGTDQIKALGKMYVGDRSKSNPVDNIKNQLSSQAGVSSVGISGKTYFEGQNEQLKSFTATVVTVTGEVRKLDFELAKIGKRKGFVQSGNTSFSIPVAGVLDKIRASLAGGGNTNKEIESLALAIGKLGSKGAALVPIFENAKNALAEFKAYESPILDKEAGGGRATKEEADELLRLAKAYQELIAKAKQLASIETPKNQLAFVNTDNENDLKQFINTAEKYEKANNRFRNNINFSDSYDNIMKRAHEALASKNFNEVDIKKLRSELRGLELDIRAADLEGQTFGTKLGTQMQKLGVYFSAASIMMGAATQIKKTISTVIELDKTVTDLAVATGMNRRNTQELLDTYSNLGKELSATTSAVAGAADDWLRQGKSIATTNELVKDSLMLSKLGKIDSSEATTALTTMSKAYKIADDDITSLVDKLTAVDAVSATTAGGIAKSFQETAVSANLAGISIDRMAGYIATVSEVSGDAPESVGTFFRTFLSRMSNIKEGRLIDPDTGEDLSTVETVLKNIGIRLRDDQLQFRNFQTVLDEIAVKWKELESTGDKVGQTKIASALGMTRQQEKAKILFEHYNEAIRYAEVSANSLGTAEDKFNNAYLTSTEASMNKFTAQFEQMSNSIWHSGLIKGSFDTGAGLLGALTWISDTVGGLPSLIGVAAGALSAMSNKGILQSSPDKDKLNIFGDLRQSYKAIALDIKKHNDIQKSSELVQTSYNETLKGSTGGFSKYALGLEGTKASMGGYIGSLIRTKVTQALVQASTIALNAALTAGVAIVISSVIELIQHQETLRKAAIDSIDSLNSEKSAINDYKTEIIALQKELQSGNLSETAAYDVRKQLMSIQDELIKKYGAEADAIDLVTDSIDGQNNALDRLSEKKNSDWLRDNQQAINNAESYINKKDYRHAALGVAPEDITEKVKSLLEPIISSVGGELSILPSVKGGKEIFVNVAGKTADEILKIYGDMYIALNELRESSDQDTQNQLAPLLEGLSNAGNRVKNDAYNDHKAIFDQRTEALVSSQENYRNLYAEALSTKKAYDDAVASDDKPRIQAAIAQIKAVENTYKSSGITDMGVVGFFDDLFKEFEIQSKKHQFELDFSVNKDGIADRVKAALGGLKGEDDLSIMSALSVGNGVAGPYSGGDGFSGGGSGGGQREALIIIEKEKSIAKLKTVAAATGIEVEALVGWLTELGLISSRPISINADIKVPDLNDVIKDIGKAKEALGSLSGILSDLQSKDSGVKFDSIERIKEQFGMLGPVYNEAISVISNSSSTYDQVQASVNSLATQYIFENKILQSVTAETKESAAAMLQSIGVSNAAEVATRAVSNSLIDEAISVELAKGQTDSLSASTEALILRQYGLAKGTEVANRALALWNLKKQIASNGTLSSFILNDTNNFFKLALAAGVAGDALDGLKNKRKEVVNLENGWGASSGGDDSNSAITSVKTSYNSYLPKIQAEIDRIQNLEIDFKAPNIKNPGTTAPKGSSASSSPSKENDEDNWLKSYQLRYDELTHLRNMDKLGTAEYYQKLKSLDNEYFSSKKALDAYGNKYLSERRKNLEELYDLEQTMSKDKIADLEHETFLLSNRTGTELQQLSLQKSIQAELHKQANARRNYLSATGMSKELIEQDDAVQDLSKQWWSVEDAIKSIIEALEEPIDSAILDALGKEKDALSEILDLTKELIREETDREITALEDKKDAYQKIIDAQKESLSLTERERSYDEDVGEKTDKLSKLQSQADILALDDSREAQLKRADLLEEMAALQKELDKTQRDHSLELQQDALDKELEDYNAAQDDKIKDLQDFLDNEEAITKKAQSRINDSIKNGSLKLYDELKQYSLKHGLEVESLSTSWEIAKKSLSGYKDILKEISDKQSEIDSIEDNKNTDNPHGFTSGQLKDQKQMQSNAIKWHSATAEERLSLEAANEVLGAKLGATKIDGTWWLNGLPLFHKGGIVGTTPTLKQNEMYATLERGEGVINSLQQSAILKLIDYAKLTPVLPDFSRLGGLSALAQSEPSKSVIIHSNINVSGDNSADMMSKLKQHAHDISNLVSKELDKQ